MLVAQPPAAEELNVHAHGGADEGSLCELTEMMTASDEERVKGAVGFVELRHIGHIVTDYQDLVQFLRLQLLRRLRDLALLLDDAAQRPSRLAPVQCSPPGPPRCTS